MSLSPVGAARPGPAVPLHTHPSRELAPGLLVSVSPALAASTRPPTPHPQAQEVGTWGGVASVLAGPHWVPSEDIIFSKSPFPAYLLFSVNWSFSPTPPPPPPQASHSFKQRPSLPSLLRCPVSLAGASFLLVSWATAAAGQSGPGAVAWVVRLPLSPGLEVAAVSRPQRAPHRVFRARLPQPGGQGSEDRVRTGVAGSAGSGRLLAGLWPGLQSRRPAPVQRA